MIIGIVTSLPWVLVMMTVIDDLQGVQKAFLPSLEVFYQATRSKPVATFLQAYLTLLYYCEYSTILPIPRSTNTSLACVPSQWITSSRIAWAFSRDVTSPLTSCRNDTYTATERSPILQLLQPHRSGAQNPHPHNTPIRRILCHLRTALHCVHRSVQLHRQHRQSHAQPHVYCPAGNPRNARPTQTAKETIQSRPCDRIRGKRVLHSVADYQRSYVLFSCDVADDGGKYELVSLSFLLSSLTTMLFSCPLRH